MDVANSKVLLTMLPRCPVTTVSLVYLCHGVDGSSTVVQPPQKSTKSKFGINGAPRSHPPVKKSTPNCLVRSRQ
jgi:hypothetical protein